MTGSWKRPLLLAAACVVAFVCVLAAAYWLPLARWADGWAVHGFLGVQRPWSTVWAMRIVHLANPLPFALATAALATVALRRGRPRHALAVVALLSTSSGASQLLKGLLAHPRPHAFLGGAQLDAASYPSGHATASMALAFAAVLVAPRALRPLVAAAGAFFTLAVCEAALLLGWHFPSDVIGGYLLATFFACVTVAGLGFADNRWPERSGREAARRMLRTSRPHRLIAPAAIGVALTVGLSSGAGLVRFADRHTTTLAAILAVAAMAAALPAAVAALSARRA